MRSTTLDLDTGPIHLREQGSGPLVVLLHGFPETARSWSHQLPALAEAGYRAIAYDQRGHGGSWVPDRDEDSRVLALVGDLVELVSASGNGRAVLIGHDWGSPLASTTALLRPDLVAGVALLGVPYTPPGGPRPSEVFRSLGGPEQFYVSYFQEPGRAEAEMQADVSAWLRGFTSALTPGGTVGAEVFFVPPGARMSDRFAAGGPAPDWLGEDELAARVAEFERTGFRGALGRYRNVDRDWEDLRPWNGRALEHPSLFVAGAEDPSITWLASAIDAFGRTMPDCRGVHLLPDAGHFVHEERPDRVNAILLDWLAGLPGWG